MYLNKFSLLFVLAFLFIQTQANASIDTLFEKANHAYTEKNYSEAVQHYEKLIQSGVSSENIYFNLANTYFQLNEKGKSILYYEKILKNNPKHTAAKNNLTFVNKKIEKPFETLPDLFFISFFKKITHLFHKSTWSYIALAFMWFALLAFLIYLYTKNILFKKIAFSNGIFFLLISVFSLVVYLYLNQQLFLSQYGIITQLETTAKAAPSSKSKNKSIFYEGSKLQFYDKVDGYYKVKNEKNEFVWILQSDFSTI